MKIVLDNDRATLLQGDAVELTEVLSENTIDALVADPPAGISFMGKEGDDDKGGADAWSQWLADTLAPSFRALKPGGHALVWAIPRTSHWTARALELAGFEIRNIHHDILSMDEVLAGFVASLDEPQRRALARVLESQTSPILYHLFGTGFPKSLDIAKQLEGTDAEKWRGFGTALKPAVEHWILARKPLEGTYAENVLKWGTGALNIDGCRIGMDTITTHSRGTNGAFPKRPTETSAQDSGRKTDQGANLDTETERTGRWPAHLSLDEAGAAALDAQSGVTKSTSSVGVKRHGRSGGIMGAVGPLRDGRPEGHNDSGGASRFFYVAKASRSEKDAGLDHLPARSGGEATDREDGSAGLKNPRAGAGRTGGARNFHPTVKNLALMRWLVRLVTPPGGIVLDPFAGSGTTGVAAIQEGLSYIGVDQGGDNGEYIPNLVGRICHALGIPPEPQA